MVRLSEKSLRAEIWYNESIKKREVTWMKYVEGEDREQMTLLPNCIEDYIGEDNPVRVIDAFVDGLNLEKLNIRQAVPNETGRPSYEPRYFNRIGPAAA